MPHMSSVNHQNLALKDIRLAHSPSGGTSVNNARAYAGKKELNAGADAFDRKFDLTRVRLLSHTSFLGKLR